MEQISFFTEDKVNYTLAIFYEYHLYETKITEKSFESEFVDFDMLGEVIQEGVLPNKSKKIDEFLHIKTSFQCDEDQQILFLDLELTYQKGRLKPRSETFDFELKKKPIDNQTTFENVMRSMEKSMNMAHIRPQSFNIFVEIDWEKEGVSFKDEIGFVKNLIKDGQLSMEFLEYIMKRDPDLKTFFANRQHSQQIIEEKLKSWIEKYFHSYKIIEILLNYISDIYFVYFVSVLDGGKYLMLNVDPKKQPLTRNYFVIKNLTKYPFDPILNYRILEKFSGIERKQLSRLEIFTLDGNNHLYVVENGSLGVNPYINLDNKFWIHVDSSGKFIDLCDKDKKTILNGQESYILDAQTKFFKIQMTYHSRWHFNIHDRNCSVSSTNTNCSNTSGKCNQFNQNNNLRLMLLQSQTPVVSSELFLVEQFS